MGRDQPQWPQYEPGPPLRRQHPQLSPSSRRRTTSRAVRAALIVLIVKVCCFVLTAISLLVVLDPLSLSSLSSSSSHLSHKARLGFAFVSASASLVADADAEAVQGGVGADETSPSANDEKDEYEDEDEYDEDEEYNEDESEQEYNEDEGEYYDQNEAPPPLMPPGPSQAELVKLRNNIRSGDDRLFRPHPTDETLSRQSDPNGPCSDSNLTLAALAFVDGYDDASGHLIHRYHHRRNWTDRIIAADILSSCAGGNPAKRSYIASLPGVHDTIVEMLDEVGLFWSGAGSDARDVSSSDTTPTDTQETDKEGKDDGKDKDKDKDKDKPSPPGAAPSPTPPPPIPSGTAMAASAAELAWTLSYDSLANRDGLLKSGAVEALGRIVVRCNPQSYYKTYQLCNPQVRMWSMAALQNLASSYCISSEEEEEEEEGEGEGNVKEESGEGGEGIKRGRPCSWIWSRGVGGGNAIDTDNNVDKGKEEEEDDDDDDVGLIVDPTQNVSVDGAPARERMVKFGGLIEAMVNEACVGPPRRRSDGGPDTTVPWVGSTAKLTSTRRELMLGTMGTEKKEEEKKEKKRDGSVEGSTAAKAKGKRKDHENKGGVEAEGYHEWKHSIVPWAAAGALKNIALSSSGREFVRTALLCLCALSASPDWLESEKAGMALYHVGMDDHCHYWTEEVAVPKKKNKVGKAKGEEEEEEEEGRGGAAEATEEGDGGKVGATAEGQADGEEVIVEIEVRAGGYCVDFEGWGYVGDEDDFITCLEYDNSLDDESEEEYGSYCDLYGHFTNEEDVDANSACCVCGGGDRVRDESGGVGEGGEEEEWQADEL